MDIIFREQGNTDPHNSWEKLVITTHEKGDSLDLCSLRPSMRFEMADTVCGML